MHIKTLRFLRWSAFYAVVDEEQDTEGDKKSRLTVKNVENLGVQVALFVPQRLWRGISYYF